MVAAAAAGIALTGMLARPLLAGSSGSLRRAAAPPPTAAAAGAVPAATRAARTALACRADLPAPGCGTLTVTRTDAYSTSVGRAVVLLVGTLTARDGVVPVAVRVTLTRAGGRWQGRVSLP